MKHLALDPQAGDAVGVRRGGIFCVFRLFCAGNESGGRFNRTLAEAQLTEPH